MKRIAKKRILKIKPYTPGRPIQEVQRQLGLNDVIKLASNESPFGPSVKTLRAIAKAARDVNRYPESSCFYLRREVARRLKVKENQLLFSNGSDEIIVLAARAFLNPGDEVIVASPSFLIYAIASKLEGAVVKSVPLKGLRYDLPAMQKAVNKKTKIIFIGNPDNPAGTYVTAKALTAFLKKVRKDVLVFLDEAYFDFVTNRDYPDGVKLLKRYRNLIVTRTFSKMYGLAGLRVGYGVAEPSLIGLLDRLREPFNVNTLAQAAALAVLKDRAYYRKVAKTIVAQRSYLRENLEALGYTVPETVTNFMLVDLKKKSTPFIKKLLLKGVIVRDMTAWGLDTFMRITIGKPKENQKLIKTLRTIQ